jgi:hypothetical protein
MSNDKAVIYVLDYLRNGPACYENLCLDAWPHCRLTRVAIKGAPSPIALQEGQHSRPLRRRRHKMFRFPKPRA